MNHLINKIKHVIMGFFVLLNIDEEKAFFCSGGIGDTFYIMLFSDEYVKANMAQNIPFFLPESHRDIVDIIKPQNTVIRFYKDKYKSTLNYYLILINRVCKNCRYKSLVPSVLNLARIDVSHSFEDVFYYDLLGLNGTIVNKIETQEQSGVDKVLVIPDANSVKSFSDSFWISLIEAIKSNTRCKIFLNMTKSKLLRSIEGIEIYDRGIAKLFHEAGGFCAIIIVRNGICDVLAKQKCNMVVLYPKDYANIDYYRLFSLDSVNRACLLEEIVIKDGEEKDFDFNRILKRIK